MYLEASVLELLGPGRALIVGTVDEHGVPHATRAWGVRPADVEGGELVVLVDPDDETGCRQLAAGREVALGATEVLSHESIQVKGKSLGLQPASAEDVAMHQAHVAKLVDRICEVDGRVHEVVIRMVPARVVVLRMRVDAAFDQTPGPDAGRCLSGQP